MKDQKFNTERDFVVEDWEFGAERGAAADSREFPVFGEELEVPEIVRKKMDAAFLQVRQTGKIVRFPSAHRNGRVRKTAAAAACAALLAAGVFTAAAAVYGQWSRSMSGELQGSPKQQRMLEESGMAVAWNGGSDGEEARLTGDGTAQEFAAVTDGGVTVRPQMAVMTDDCAWISFSVDGYVPVEGEQPDFEEVTLYLGDDPEAESGQVNANFGFYDGIVMDAGGSPVYDDGTPLKHTPDGRTMERYADENGTLEYVLYLFPVSGGSLADQTLHVRFENLGTVGRAAYTPDRTGVWEFTLPLTGSAEARICRSDAEIGDSGAVLCRAELTPVSVKAHLSFRTPESEEAREEMNLKVSGIRLKDGTMLPYITDGGRVTYAEGEEEPLTLFYSLSRIIDPAEADALLFLNPLAGPDAAPEDRFCIVPLEP